MTAADTDVLLDVRHLCTTFPVHGRNVAAVDDVSFVIRRGETLGLVGESGSGKSVTALSLVQLVASPGKVASGAVLFEGQDLCALDDGAMRRIRGRHIGFIFQEPMVALDPVYTIGAQIEETLLVHGLAQGTAARRRALELLDAVRIPDPERRHREYPHQLSGGLRQRAMIALALTAEPSLVIADEPTTALDVTVQAEILDLLRDMRRTFSLAILLITHDLGVVAAMAHRVAVMYSGNIVEDGPVAHVLATPAHPYTRALLTSIPGTRPGARLPAIAGTVPALDHRPAGCRFAPRCPNRFEPCETMPDVRLAGPDHAVRCFLDGPAEAEAPARQKSIVTVHAPSDADRAVAHAVHATTRADRATADTSGAQGLQPLRNSPLVQVRGLVKEFRGRRGLFGAVTTVRAVDDVSFSIGGGETFGLVGESGCGKTTTGRCLLRLVEPTAGDMRFKDMDLRALSAKDLRAARRHFQIVFQDPYSSLDPRMRAGAIVEEPLIVHHIGTTSARRDRVRHLLDLVGLDADAATKYPHEFSGGQRQRIGLARALALEPSLVVADEPVSALDVSVQAQVVNLLLDLQQRLGLTYLFIAHDLRLVREICTRVAVMYRGRLVEVAPVKRLFDAPVHEYTRALLSAVPSLDPHAPQTRVAFDTSRLERLPLREVSPGHWAAV